MVIGQITTVPRRTSHWGRGGLETNENILSTLQALVDVEQAVVYSTLPQEYSTLTFRGEVLLDGGGVEERSEVMYWHRRAYIIYYRSITCHSYTA